MVLHFNGIDIFCIFQYLVFEGLCHLRYIYIYIYIYILDEPDMQDIAGEAEMNS